MNKLKKYLEEYLDSGMWQYEAPYIGKEDVETILDVFNALDKAIELLDSNMLCENCPFPKNAECCTTEGCREYIKECLLNGNYDGCGKTV